MEINYVCSLGTFCHSANLLKRNGLKKCSYPFDWIFSSTDIVMSCLDDDFATFLNKTYYTDISNTQCGHTIYCKNLFNHHNPLINPDDYSYFIRCVDRFRNLLTQKEKKLFVLFNIYLINKDKIIDLYKKLSDFTTNYILLFIMIKQNQPINSHTFTHNDNVHFLEIDILSETNGILFTNNIDNEYLDNILHSNYKFNIFINDSGENNNNQMFY